MRQKTDTDQGVPKWMYAIPVVAIAATAIAATVIVKRSRPNDDGASPVAAASTAPHELGTPRSTSPSPPAQQARSTGDAASRLPSTPPPSPVSVRNARFVAVTEGQVGFRAGTQFYPVGMDARDFLRLFGKPTVGVPEGQMHYHDDGLLVNIRDYRITRFVFYLKTQPSSVGSGIVTAADIVTDRGVDSSSSQEEVVKAHGPALPGSPRQFLGSTLLDYRWGTASFTDGRLEHLYVGGAD